jgi:hypothetical protein
MKSQNFPSRPNLLPTRPSASNSPIKTATTIDCRVWNRVPDELVDHRKVDIVERARGRGHLQRRDLDAAGIVDDVELSDVGRP